MKRKDLLLLVRVALVLAVIGTLWQIIQTFGWSSGGDRQIFKNLPLNDVTKVILKQGKETVTLTRPVDRWVLTERQGYPADYNRLRTLLLSLNELKSVRDETINDAVLGRLNLLPPGEGDQRGLGLTLLQKDEKTVAQLVIGKTMETSGETGFSSNGRFVLNPEHKDHAYLVSETFSSIDPLNVANWLDKTFFRAENLVFVERGAVGKDPGWKILRADPKAEWKLDNEKPNEALDRDAIATLGSFAPNFADVKSRETAVTETGLDHPMTVTLIAEDGFHYQLEIGKSGPDQSHFVRVQVTADPPKARKADPKEKPEDKKKNDDEFAKQQETAKKRLADEEMYDHWIYVVQDYSLEPLLKARTDVVKTATPASPTPPPAPVPGLPGVTPAATIGLDSKTVVPTLSPAPLATPPSLTTPTPSATPSPNPAPLGGTPALSPGPSPAPGAIDTPSPGAAAEPSPNALGTPPRLGESSAVPAPSPAETLPATPVVVGPTAPAGSATPSPTLPAGPVAVTPTPITLPGAPVATPTPAE